MSAYRRVLRHRDFRRLFWGQSASTFGDQIVIVALALYVTRTTGSATDLSLVLMAQSLPLMGLILFGGVWADRGGGRGRVRNMIVCDGIRAGLHGLFAVLILAGSVAVWEMIVIEALFGAARAFFQPAFTGLLPQTVPDEAMSDARALTEGAMTVSALVGPAVSTVLFLAFGAGVAFAIDAATFVVSAALLAGVHPRERGGEEELPHESVISGLRAGFVEVSSRTWVWVTIVVFTGFMFFVYAQWYALAPIIARDHYGGASVFGVLEAVAGGGSLVATVVALFWRPSRPLWIGLAMTLFWPVDTFLFALGAPVGIVGVLAACAGFGFGLLMVWWEVALAHYIPPGALSRVSSYDWMGALALMPVGFAVAGPLAAAVGPRLVLAVGSVAGFVLLALSLLPRSTRNLPGPPAPPATPLPATASVSAEQLAGEVGVAAGGEA